MFIRVRPWLNAVFRLNGQDWFRLSLELLEQLLANLHRIESRAFKELIAGHPETQPVVHRAILADTAHSAIVLLGHVEWQRVLIFGRFIDESKGMASGWVGFYWGQTRGELRESKTISGALTRGWLEFFERRSKEIQR